MTEQPNFGVDLLRRKYPRLHTTEEVDKAVQKKSRLESLTARETNKINSDPIAKIKVYLSRFEALLNSGLDEKVRTRNLNLIKQSAHKLFVINEEDIPESVYKLEQGIARELGHGLVPITEEFIKQKNAEIINGQIKSLDRWIDYLSGPNTYYENWFKYIVFRSLISMSEFNKELGIYENRSKKTAKAFPEINSEALGIVERLIKEAGTLK